MIKELIWGAVIVLLTILISCQASYSYTTWDNSPINWENSELNWENSPMNFKNSPLNWNNSPLNMDSRTIRDNYGNPVGYAVPKQGGYNIYDSYGNRVMYYNY